jgi:prevent-host-death family protein
MNNINLAEARQNLPELTDRAYAGQTFVLARRGRKLAVIMGIDEYLRLKEIEQRERDFEILLSPPRAGEDELSEEEAIDLAVQAVREVRAERHAARKGLRINEE